ncbi:uncharacterized protein LOC103308681 [Acyrthosiphon pisum]|uniref:Regulatory protein zeste n=1 Tax=Acyrthosiphon pisum TaxID=7029 RepID=A0A8R2AZI3_ACYPI|nr:uncharacterized protein LOC103308681 [Acyrthosiphon pisum]|eukprot:XP_008180704.1 PREDICTED: uncharacterized protein LOC103308681 [Acyrthosiphon pisum]
MPKTTPKRPRCTNFTPGEENTLVALAVKHATVLECRKSDHDVWGAKTEAWSQIQKQFIASTGKVRDVQNLKDKYENLKRKTKKVESDRKKNIFQTGGGASTSCSVKTSASHNMMLAVLGVSAVGLHNPFDGDKPGKSLINPEMIGNIDDGEDNVIVVKDGGEMELDMSSNMEYIQVHMGSDDEMDMPSVAVLVEDLPVQPSWTKWNPELLTQPKSTELLTPLSSKKTIKTTLGESVKQYSLGKLELINEQKKYFQNEDRRAQEKHDAEQLQAKEKQMLEKIKNKLVIEKLQLEINDLKKRSKD